METNIATKSEEVRVGEVNATPFSTTVASMHQRRTGHIVWLAQARRCCDTYLGWAGDRVPGIFHTSDGYSVDIQPSQCGGCGSVIWPFGAVIVTDETKVDEEAERIKTAWRADHDGKIASIRKSLETQLAEALATLEAGDEIESSDFYPGVYIDAALSLVTAWDYEPDTIDGESLIEVSAPLTVR